jgi:hypothetical protein
VARVPLNAIHGVISQKKILFKTTAVKISNPTYRIVVELLSLTRAYFIVAIHSNVKIITLWACAIVLHFFLNPVS